MENWQVTAKLFRYGYQFLHAVEDSAKDAEVDKEALAHFQEDAGLQPTGEVDEATVEILKMPRCAMADVSHLPPDSDQSSRLTTEGGGRDRAQRITARSRWNKKVLTWRVTKLPANGMPAELVDLSLRRAFRCWEKTADLKFQWLEKGVPDMEIRWETGNHGCADVFDGSGGTLAHGFFPRGTRLSGDLHLDDSENWSLGCNTGINLTQAACHEMGHALGLEHSTDMAALMAPTYRGFVPCELGKDDIAKIQDLYGAAKEQPEEVAPEEVWVAGQHPGRPVGSPCEESLPGPAVHYTAEGTKTGDTFVLTVLKCSNLPNTDSSLVPWNRTDAYIKVKVGSQKEQRTPTIMDDLDPVFEKDNVFIFEGGAGTEVELTCLDWDPMSSDDVIVKARIRLTDEILRGGERATALVLEDSSGKLVQQDDISGQQDDVSGQLLLSQSSVGTNSVAGDGARGHTYGNTAPAWALGPGGSSTNTSKTWGPGEGGPVSLESMGMAGLRPGVHNNKVNKVTGEGCKQQ